MTEKIDVKAEDEEAPINPFIDIIDKQAAISSVRELIGNAFVGEGVTPWDLPEDPEKLKKVLSEAVDYAVSRKKAIEEEAK